MSDFFGVYSERPQPCRQALGFLLGGLSPKVFVLRLLLQRLDAFFGGWQQVALAIPPAQPRDFTVLVAPVPNTQFDAQWRNGIMPTRVGPHHVVPAAGKVADRYAAGITLED